MNSPVEMRCPCCGWTHEVPYSAAHNAICQPCVSRSAVVTMGFAVARNEGNQKVKGRKTGHYRKTKTRGGVTR